MVRLDFVGRLCGKVKVVRQIKIFKGSETDLPHLEESVNRWIAENQVEVVQVFGNIAPQTVFPDANRAVLHKTAYTPADILIVVVYEAKAEVTSKEA